VTDWPARTHSALSRLLRFARSSARLWSGAYCRGTLDEKQEYCRTGIRPVIGCHACPPCVGVVTIRGLGSPEANYTLRNLLSQVHKRMVPSGRARDVASSISLTIDGQLLPNPIKEELPTTRQLTARRLSSRVPNLADANCFQPNRNTIPAPNLKLFCRLLSPSGIFAAWKSLPPLRVPN
jgi:hypothetical protein